MPRRDAGSRWVAAPAGSVYAALTDPAILVRWVPPAGMTARIEHFDPRPGGRYRMVLTYADASVPGKSGDASDVVEARFVDVVPGRRVAYEADFVSDDPAYAGTMTMAWDLTPQEGGTRVDVTADGVPDGVPEEDHRAGIASTLANLAALLESRSA